MRLYLPDDPVGVRLQPAPLVALARWVQCQWKASVRSQLPATVYEYMTDRQQATNAFLTCKDDFIRIPVYQSANLQRPTGRSRPRRSS